MILAFSGIIPISIIACILLYRYNKITEEVSGLKRIIGELQITEHNQKRRIRDLNSVVQSDETERSRLARCLHDGLGGLLSGLKLTLMNMKGNALITSEGMDLYDHALGLLDTSIKELQHVSQSLMPEALSRFGLKQTLADFCEGSGTADLKINFSFYGIEKRYDNKVEIAVYRVILDLINISIKHLLADQITVQLISEEGRLSITVQDNGDGMNKETYNHSYWKGLANIRSRITSFDGHFDLSWEHGKGTDAIIEFKV